MSFDWLNVPGLVLTDENKRESRIVPPNVSFDFNIPSVTPGATSAPVSNAPTPEAAINNAATVVGPAPYGPRKSNNPFSSSDPMLQNSTAPSLPQNIVATTMATPTTSNTAAPTETQQDQDEDYRETPEDLKVPLSLSQTQLTREELKTYLRWYKCITLRTHSKLVRLQDVFAFLSNFSITDRIKTRIQFIFRSCKNALNIGQFFAVLRLISRALAGQNADGSGGGGAVLPSRRMLLERAPIPQPRSILSSESNREVYEEVDVDDEIDDDDGNLGGGRSGQMNGKGSGAKGVDFDSFTSLLLTGKTTRKQVRRKILNEAYRNKKVRFSDHVTFQDPVPVEEDSGSATAGSSGMNIGTSVGVNNNDNNSDVVGSTASQGPLDLSLPMDQLLKLLEKRKNNSALVSTLPSEQTETEEEREELRDMQDSLSHFKQIQAVDSVAVMGSGYGFPHDFVGNSNNYTGTSGMGVGQPPLEPLKPTATGSANHFMRQEYNQVYASSQNSGLDSTGAENPNMPPQPLKPTATGSANYLVRSQMSASQPQQQQQQQQQTNTQYSTFNISNSSGNNGNGIESASAMNQVGTNILQPLKPTATGSANYLVRQQQHQQNPPPSQSQSQQQSQSQSQPQQQPQQPSLASSYVMQRQGTVPRISTPPSSTNENIIITNVDNNIHIGGRTFQSSNSQNQAQQPSQFMNFPQHRIYVQQQQQQQQQSFRQPSPPPPPQTHLQPQRQIQPQQQQYQQQSHNLQPPVPQNVQGQAGFTTPTTPQGSFQGNFSQQTPHMQSQQQQQQQQQHGSVMVTYPPRPNNVLQQQQQPANPQPQQMQLQPPERGQFSPSNLLAPQSTAGSYFQSLLTHTPSSNTGRQGGTTSRNGTGGSNLMPQPAYYSNPGNSNSNLSIADGNTSRNGTGGSNIMPQPVFYNNNSNMNYSGGGVNINNNMQNYASQPYHQQMQQQQPQPQRQPGIEVNNRTNLTQPTMSTLPANYYPNTNAGNFVNSSTSGQRMPIQNSNVGMHNYTYGTRTGTDSPLSSNQGGGNILGNYQAMQQQINSLNNAYNKR